MQVLEPEAVAPGAVQATPRPPMPKANQPEAKKSRVQRWKKDPSEMEKDMAKQREALARVEKEDAQVHTNPVRCRAVVACPGSTSLGLIGAGVPAVWVRRRVP